MKSGKANLVLVEEVASIICEACEIEFVLIAPWSEYEWMQQQKCDYCPYCGANFALALEKSQGLDAERKEKDGARKQVME